VVDEAAVGREGIREQEEWYPWAQGGDLHVGPPQSGSRGLSMLAAEPGFPFGQME